MSGIKCNTRVPQRQYLPLQLFPSSPLLLLCQIVSWSRYCSDSGPCRPFVALQVDLERESFSGQDYVSRRKVVQSCDTAWVLPKFLPYKTFHATMHLAARVPEAILPTCPSCVENTVDHKSIRVNAVSLERKPRSKCPSIAACLSHITA